MIKDPNNNLIMIHYGRKERYNNIVVITVVIMVRALLRHNVLAMEHLSIVMQYHKRAKKEFLIVPV